MVVCQPSDLIEVRRLDNRGRGGRGVFAMRDIPADTVIERVPVILIPREQVFGTTPEAKRSARISWYVFDWEGITKRKYVALALGYGSIYNHSYAPNARYKPQAPDILEFTSLRAIAAGEEITINYHGKPDDARPVEFDVH
jgi:SET domain-containing protein